jgi:hypothetical protein
MSIAHRGFFRPCDFDFACTTVHPSSEEFPAVDCGKFESLDPTHVGESIEVSKRDVQREEVQFVMPKRKEIFFKFVLRDVCMSESPSRL